MDVGNRVALALTAVACAVALAACGSSNTPSGSGSTGGGGTEAQLVRYSACMRDHGVSGFPDPSTSESGSNGFGIDGYNFNLPSNMNTQSPAYDSAAKTCGKQIGVGPGTGGRHSIAEAARQAALKHAECMRTQGVPSYPDPTFSGNGGITQISGGGSAENPRSPAFQQAQKDCNASR